MDLKSLKEFSKSFRDSIVRNNKFPERLLVASILQEYLDDEAFDRLFSALNISVDERVGATTLVCGVQIRCRASSNSDISPTKIVMTPSAEQNLKSLAYSFMFSSLIGTSGRPILIEGPAGSGKTTLLRHLASLTGWSSDMVELHLDDSTDGKSLLGSYICTDIPGEFKWQAGAITSAVMTGRWVLIEDIDKAPFEVLAALTQLVETRTIQLSERPRTIKAHPDFQLFATRTANYVPSTIGNRLQAISGPFAAFSDSWFRVPFVDLQTSSSASIDTKLALQESSSQSLEGMSVDVDAESEEANDSLELTSPDDFELILTRKFPSFSGELAAGLLATYRTLKRAYASRRPQKRTEEDFNVIDSGVSDLGRYGRHLTLRDMLRMARRIATLSPISRRLLSVLSSRDSGSASKFFLTESDRLGIAFECASVAVAHVPVKDVRRAVLRALCSVWAVSSDLQTTLEAWIPDLSYAAAVPSAAIAETYDSVEHLGAVSAPTLPPAVPCLLTGSICVPLTVEVENRRRTLGNYPPPLPLGFARLGHSLRLLERLASCVALGEPTLLVGETGNGKTSVIQALAHASGNSLLVYNLNVQSDSSDLVGGFRPVHLSQMAAPLVARLDALAAVLFHVSPASLVEAANSPAAEGKEGEVLEALQADCARRRTGVAAFLDAVRTSARTQDWTRFIGGCVRSIQRAESLLEEIAAWETAVSARIRRQLMEAVGVPPASQQRQQWGRFTADVQLFERQFVNSNPALESADEPKEGGKFAFSFVEGVLVQALRTGQWLLLDEINLASSETLQRLSGILEGGSIVLTEQGSADPVPRHPNFRFFAAMNPSTDFGKRDLPAALRARFAEIYVDDVEDIEDVKIVVRAYLGDLADSRLAPLARTLSSAGLDGMQARDRLEWLVEQVARFYLRARALSAPVTGVLRDGGNARPHYSLRSLTRALKAAKDMISQGFSVLRALGEGVSMSFLTQLEPGSLATMVQAARETFCPLSSPSTASSSNITGSKKEKKQSQLAQSVLANLKQSTGGSAAAEDDLLLVDEQDQVGCPAGLQDPIQVEGFWLRKGPLPPEDFTLSKEKPSSLRSPHSASSSSDTLIENSSTEEDVIPPRYVLVPSVRRHVRSIMRAVACGRFPCLLQGPTSAGKTSLIEYVAALTGHPCVRINNHELTDISEYIGSYVTGPGGQMVFSEGLLVRALRQGQWIILDELNLAPSEVLEALNRLLDDNRELYIPETQETVRPHPQFMLFATQNPVAGYGGRKPLSLAFRNRFVEIHMEDIPVPELKAIVAQRARLPASFVEKMLDVMLRLRLARQASNVFAGATGLITPRDLLRWGARKPSTYVELALQGFLLLGERLRSERERAAVRAVVEEVCRVELDLERVYDHPFREALQDSLIAEAVESEEVREDSSDNTLEQRDEGDKRSRSESLSHPSDTEISRKRRKLVITEFPNASSSTSSVSASSAFMQRLHASLDAFLRNLRTPLSPLTPPLPTVPGAEGLGSVALTSSLRRLFTLVAQCVMNDEPVLLVGETGCGKTTVVQLLALLLQRPLSVVNCHAHSEAADFVGSLRPARATSNAAREARFRALLQRAQEQLQPLLSVLPESVQAAAAAFDKIVADPDLSMSAAATSLATLVDAAAQLQDPHPHVGELINTLNSLRELEKQSEALFEWVDGPLVAAMKQGHFFLLDEMSLAEDAVLERLNSVLEPSRTLTLAEKADDSTPGSAAAKDDIVVRAKRDFRIFATMNPGGDFGKRELSPALRNRFTEIWVPSLLNEADLRLVLEGKLQDLLNAAVKDAMSEVASSSDGNAVPDTAPELKERSLDQHFTSEPSPVAIQTAVPMTQYRRQLLPFLTPMIEFVQWFDAVAAYGQDDLTFFQRKYTSERPLNLSFDEFLRSRRPGAQDSAVVAAGEQSGRSKIFQLSLRDLHSWLTFLSRMALRLAPDAHQQAALWLMYTHGCCLTLLDGLGLGMGLSEIALSRVKEAASEAIYLQAPLSVRMLLRPVLRLPAPLPEPDALQKVYSNFSATSLVKVNGVLSDEEFFGSSPFFIPTGHRARPQHSVSSLSYNLGSPTTHSNLSRVLRALQLRKPVLLEGSPGVGKTSLIEVLAKAAGKRLVRINLSDQTDVSDLFGQDLPEVPSDAAAPAGKSRRQFRWCDGVFLAALKAGDWVLLDELNLAPQAVLEGLNAVLDHRSTVYIPQLDQSFSCPPSFQVFATQNPVGQGGGRKGLPKSFLNRFAKVFVESLTEEDQVFIARSMYPVLDIPMSLPHPGDNEDGAAREPVQLDGPSMLRRMVRFNIQLHNDTMGRPLSSRQEDHSNSANNAGPIYGNEGRPWEFNLRDLFRWCDAIIAANFLGSNSAESQEGPKLFVNPGAFVHFAYLQRLRSPRDMVAAAWRFIQIFTESTNLSSSTLNSECIASLLPLRFQPRLRVSRLSLAVDDACTHRALLPGVWSPPRVNLLNLPSRKSQGVHLFLEFLRLSAESPISVARMQQQDGSVQELCSLESPESLQQSWKSDFEFLDIKTTEDSIPSSLLRTVYHLISAVNTASPVLLVGPKSSGKTASVLELARLTGAHVRTLSLTPATDATELIGCFEQADASRGVLRVADTALGLCLGLEFALLTLPFESTISIALKNSALELVGFRGVAAHLRAARVSFQALLAARDPLLAVPSLSELADLLNSAFDAVRAIILAQLNEEQQLALEPFRASLAALLVAVGGLGAPSGGSFEWIDGALLEAMERGEWVLLENVNFCSAAVLDRLNPVLERNGRLLVSECGLGPDGRVRVVQPHPSFRLFFTLDPAWGEVSRALRNRCVEIALGSRPSTFAPVLSQDPANEKLVEDLASLAHLRPQIMGQSVPCNVSEAADVVLWRILRASSLSRADCLRVIARAAGVSHGKSLNSRGNDSRSVLLSQHAKLMLNAHTLAARTAAQPGAALEPPRPRQLALLAKLSASLFGKLLQDRRLQRAGKLQNSVSSEVTSAGPAFSEALRVSYRSHGGTRSVSDAFSSQFREMTASLVDVSLFTDSMDPAETLKVPADNGLPLLSAFLSTRPLDQLLAVAVDPAAALESLWAGLVPYFSDLPVTSEGFKGDLIDESEEISRLRVLPRGLTEGHAVSSLFLEEFLAELVARHFMTTLSPLFSEESVESAANMILERLDLLATEHRINARVHSLVHACVSSVRRLLTAELAVQLRDGFLDLVSAYNLEYNTQKPLECASSTPKPTQKNVVAELLPLLTLDMTESERLWSALRAYLYQSPCPTAAAGFPSLEAAANALCLSLRDSTRSAALAQSVLLMATTSNGPPRLLHLSIMLAARLGLPLPETVRSAADVLPGQGEAAMPARELERLLGGFGPAHLISVSFGILEMAEALAGRSVSGVGASPSSIRRLSRGASAAAAAARALLSIFAMEVPRASSGALLRLGLNPMAMPRLVLGLRGLLSAAAPLLLAVTESGIPNLHLEDVHPISLSFSEVEIESLRKLERSLLQCVSCFFVLPAAAQEALTLRQAAAMVSASAVMYKDVSTHWLQPFLKSSGRTNLRMWGQPRLPRGPASHAALQTLKTVLATLDAPLFPFELVIASEAAAGARKSSSALGHSGTLQDPADPSKFLSVLDLVPSRLRSAILSATALLVQLSGSRNTPEAQVESALKTLSALLTSALGALATRSNAINRGVLPPLQSGRVLASNKESLALEDNSMDASQESGLVSLAEGYHLRRQHEEAHLQVVLDARARAIERTRSSAPGSSNMDLNQDLELDENDPFLGVDPLLIDRLQLGPVRGGLLRKRLRLEPLLAESLERFVLVLERAVNLGAVRLTLQLQQLLLARSQASSELSLRVVSLGEELLFSIRKAIPIAISGCRWTPLQMQPLQSLLWAVEASIQCVRAPSTSETSLSQLLATLQDTTEDHARSWVMRVPSAAAAVAPAVSFIRGGNYSLSQVETEAVRALLRAPCALHELEERTYLLQLLAGHSVSNHIVNPLDLQKNIYSDDVKVADEKSHWSNIFVAPVLILLAFFKSSLSVDDTEDCGPSAHLIQQFLEASETNSALEIRSSIRALMDKVSEVAAAETAPRAVLRALPQASELATALCDVMQAPSPCATALLLVKAARLRLSLSAPEAASDPALEPLATLEQLSVLRERSAASVTVHGLARAVAGSVDAAAQFPLVSSRESPSQVLALQNSADSAVRALGRDIKALDAAMDAFRDRIVFRPGVIMEYRTFVARNFILLSAPSQSSSVSSRVESGSASEGSNFQGFFNEAQYFLTQLVSPMKVQELLQTLTQPTVSLPDRLSASGWCDSVLAFAKRVQTQYCDLGDLTTPLTNAAAELAFAVSMLASFDSDSSRSVSTTHSPNNTAVNSAVVKASLLQSPVSFTNESKSELDSLDLLARLMEAAYAAHVRSAAAPVNVAAGSSLTLTSETEEERSEREFREKIPDFFEAHFSEFFRSKQEMLEEFDHGAAVKRAEAVNSAGRSAFSPAGGLEPLAKVLDTYSDFFRVSSSFSGTEGVNGNSGAVSLQALLATLTDTDVLTSPAPSLWRPGGPVPTLLHGILEASNRPNEGEDAASKVSSKLLGTEGDASRSSYSYCLPGVHAYDFYRDSNLPEASLVIRPLVSLAKRAFALLAQFPQNEVLCVLLRVVEQVLRLPAASPVAALLAGLDTVVLKAVDWDANAPMHLKLGEPLKQVEALISRWHALELQSWPRLLVAVESEEKLKCGGVFCLLRNALLVLPDDIRESLESLQDSGGLSDVETGRSIGTKELDGRDYQAAALDRAARWVSTSLAGDFRSVSETPACSNSQEGPRYGGLLGVLQWALPFLAVNSFNTEVTALVPMPAHHGAALLPDPEQKGDSLPASLKHLNGRWNCLLLHLKGCFEAVDVFLRGSPQGQFLFRLRLVESLAAELEARSIKCADSPVSAFLQVLSTLCRNVGRFYEQYALPVQQALESNANTILKDISDQVKIHRWDSQSEYSKRESAEKSHRIVFRAVQRYREVLETVVGPVIEEFKPDETATGVAAVSGRVVGEGRIKFSRITRVLNRRSKRDVASNASNASDGEINEESLILQKYLSARLTAVTSRATSRLLVSLQTTQHELTAVAKRAAQLLLRESSGVLGYRALTNRREASSLVHSMSQLVKDTFEANQGTRSTRMMKQRALVSTLRALNRFGLSSLMASAPAAQKVIFLVSAVPAFDFAVLAADSDLPFDPELSGLPENEHALLLDQLTVPEGLSKELGTTLAAPVASSASLVPVLRTAEELFLKTTDQLIRLRARAAAGQWHEDLSKVEIGRSLAMIEHAYFLEIQQRVVLRATSQHGATLALLLRALRARAAAASRRSLSLPLPARFCDRRLAARVLDAVVPVATSLRNARALLNGLRALLRLIARTTLSQASRSAGTAAASADAEERSAIDAMNELLTEVISEESVLLGLALAPDASVDTIVSATTERMRAVTQAATTVQELEGTVLSASDKLRSVMYSDRVLGQLNSFINGSPLVRLDGAADEHGRYDLLQALPVPMSAATAVAEALNTTSRAVEAMVEVEYAASVPFAHPVLFSAFSALAESTRAALTSCNSLCSPLLSRELTSDAMELDLSNEDDDVAVDPELQEEFLVQEVRATTLELMATVQRLVPVGARPRADTLESIWGFTDITAVEKFDEDEEAEMMKDSEESEDSSEYEQTSFNVLLQHQQALFSLEQLGLPHLISRLIRFERISRRVTLSKPLADAFSALLSLVEMVQSVHRCFQSDLSTLHHSLSQLSLTSSRILLQLMDNGFCLPKRSDGEPGDSSGGGDGGDGAKPPNTQKFNTGTGVGEGDTTGSKDVSDQIESEDQVLGLQSDVPHEPPEGTEGPQQDLDKGLDMQNDFEGEMHSLPKRDAGGEDDEEQGPEADAEREMGDADDENKQVLDEKLWDPKQDEDDKDGDSKGAPEKGDKALKGMEDDQQELGTRAAEDDSQDAQDPKDQSKQTEDQKKDQKEPQKESKDSKEQDDSAEKDEGQQHDADDDVHQELAAKDNMGVDSDSDAPADFDSDEEKDKKDEPEGFQNKLRETEEDAMQEEEALPEADTPEGKDEDEQGPKPEEGGEEEFHGLDAEMDPSREQEMPQPDADDAAELPDLMDRQKLDQDGEDAKEEQAEEPDLDMEGSDAEGVQLDLQDPLDDLKSPEPEEERKDEQETAAPDSPPEEAPDTNKQKTAASSGVASSGGDSALASADRSEQPQSKANEQQQDQDQDQEKDEVMEAEEDAEAEHSLDIAAEAADEEPCEGRDSSADNKAGKADSSAKEGTWHRAPSEQDQNSSTSRARARTRPPQASSKSQPNPLLDASKALKHWEAKIEAGPSLPDDAQQEEEDSEVQHNDGGQHSGEQHVSMDNRGGSSMLAASEQPPPPPPSEQPTNNDEDAENPQDNDSMEVEDATLNEANSKEEAEPTMKDDNGGSMNEDDVDLGAEAKQRPKAPGAGALGPEDPSGQGLGDAAEDEPELLDSVEKYQEELRSSLADSNANTNDALGGDATVTNLGFAASADEDMIETEDVDSAEFLENVRNEYERNLALLAAEGTPEAASRAWQALQSLTSDASSRLCESLRLILEPTLASKLGGEYRTGKRINMRKVIPYIASSFRKDRIWLRRSKPSKRTYQVFVGIDDSLSMSPINRGGGAVACEAMTLLLRALSKLEVGEVAVGAYGSKMKLLHAFNSPFSDDVGSRILSEFSFSQRETRTDNVLEGLVKLMKEARERSSLSSGLSTSKCLQLAFLISDGIVGTGKEREKIRQWVMEAQKLGILIVMVIVDQNSALGNGSATGNSSDNSQNSHADSILNTFSVKFVKGQVVKNNYLDDYPFPYYLVIRDTRTLPEVLSEALRQWFELFGSSE